MLSAIKSTALKLSFQTNKILGFIALMSHAFRFSEYTELLQDYFSLILHRNKSTKGSTVDIFVGLIYFQLETWKDK